MLVAMPAWVFWSVLAAVLGIAEIFTVTLVLGMVAGAAVLAAVVAAVGGGVVAQLVAFIAASLALLLVVRPTARKHLRTTPSIRTGIEALTGARGVVTERVDANGGRVKVGGEIWSARTSLAHEVLEPGQQVEVVRIEGATALVYGTEPTWTP